MLDVQRSRAHLLSALRPARHPLDAVELQEHLDRAPGFRRDSRAVRRAEELTCGREDSNLHGPMAHQDLNLARMPIPPRPRIGKSPHLHSKSTVARGLVGF